MREEWESAFIESAEELQVRAPAARAAGVHPDTVRYHIRRDEAFARRVERALGGGKARRIGAGLLLLLALVLPCGATVTSSPVDLGSAGLSVSVGLRRWQESAPTAWPTVSTSGVTVSDLGGGLYTVSGLPLATGTDRFNVRLSVGGVGVASYSYGSSPGVSLLWKEELDLPSAPAVFKQGDTYGALALGVRRRLPAAVCEPGTTATFAAANAQTGVVLFTGRAATITNCEFDNSTSSYGATFTTDMSGALGTVGRFFAEVSICYQPGVCQTLPSDNRLQFSVVKRLGP